ncbi:MAG: fumarylacetoacetate hydrolase family protein [Nocardia sp.]|uniref:fumarylacetoacetate hydrolase family protein n=1 Tax=Nocardia sp. TaxID=1821 RepID=UPI002625DD6B|nr:fumarylacetoacetate hydrolase family protein [Nocardia sp.]MCU1639988.1 fumarylacetoacetate hydrolase family protein [Nocardia sp.]
MSICLLRTADSWWVQTSSTTAVRVDTTATTTAEILADRAAIHAAATGADIALVGELALLSPVTAPCRVIAQMTNYASHVRESGGNPDQVPLTFFRKSSASISGPYDDVIRPGHVRLLDYEAEIGVVVGRAVPVGTDLTAENYTGYLAGLVVTNDVSARDVQLPQTQFYEAKSYPTFTPAGPALVLLDDDEFKRFTDLRLRLWVNGELRQNMTVHDIIFPPLQALQSLTRFQQLDAGDLLLTGTPGGTALRAPGKLVQLLGSLLPAPMRWKAFFDKQAKNPKYLQDGDIVEVAVATDDGAIDLGRQRTVVRTAR